ncbi:peptidylprolyl isomerase [Planctomycetota bacterium]
MQGGLDGGVEVRRTLRAVLASFLLVAVVCVPCVQRVSGDDAAANGVSGADDGAPEAPRTDGEPGPAGAGEAETEKALADRSVVAVVNGRQLTRGEFKEFLFRSYASAITVFINEVLVEDAAGRSGILASPKAEKEWIEQKIALVRDNPDYDYTDEQLNELRQTYKGQARIGCLLEQLVRKSRSTEAEVRRLYLLRYGERRRARHILYAVSPPADAGEQAISALDAEARRKAERALELILRGAEFADVARRESQDPGSAARGGELPMLGRHEMGELLAKALFALKPGELKEPVRTGFGWHVLQVIEVQPVARPFDARVRAELESEVGDRPVQWEELTTYLERLRREAQVEVRLP